MLNAGTNPTHVLFKTDENLPEELAYAADFEREELPALPA
jgi:hypothetical protein